MADRPARISDTEQTQGGHQSGDKQEPGWKSKSFRSEKASTKPASHKARRLHAQRIPSFFSSHHESTQSHLEDSPQPDVEHQIAFNEKDIVHSPEPDHMVEVLQSKAIDSVGDAMPRECTSMVLHVCEAYADMKVYQRKLRKELEEAQTGRGKDSVSFDHEKSVWHVQEAKYLAEIKRLEVIISQGDAGMKAFALARTGSLIRQEQADSKAYMKSHEFPDKSCSTNLGFLSDKSRSGLQQEFDSNDSTPRASSIANTFEAGPPEKAKRVEVETSTFKASRPISSPKEEHSKRLHSPPHLNSPWQQPNRAQDKMTPTSLERDSSPSSEDVPAGVEKRRSQSQPSREEMVAGGTSYMTSQDVVSPAVVPSTNTPKHDLGSREGDPLSTPKDLVTTDQPEGDDLYGSTPPQRGHALNRTGAFSWHDPSRKLSYRRGDDAFAQYYHGLTSMNENERKMSFEEGDDDTDQVGQHRIVPREAEQESDVSQTAYHDPLEGEDTTGSPGHIPSKDKQSSTGDASFNPSEGGITLAPVPDSLVKSKKRRTQHKKTTGSGDSVETVVRWSDRNKKEKRKDSSGDDRRNSSSDSVIAANRAFSGASQESSPSSRSSKPRS